MLVPVVLSRVVKRRSALLTSLGAHWKMEEASGTRNDSHGTNHLTDNNTVTAAGGKVGTNAAQFTAANLEYFSLADNAALSVGDIDFCFVVWVYLDSKGTNRTILVKGTANTTAGLEYRLYFNSVADRFDWDVSNGTTLTTVRANNLGAPSLATWYQLACWHDSVNNQIGIQGNNGTADTAAHTVGSQDTAGNFRIGARVDSATLHWDGRVDSVSFWKRVLTAGEKTSLYNAGAGLDYPFS
jgi:hypothetical protein